MSITVMGAILTFAFSCLFLHFIQRDLNPISDAVSYYMNGRFGWILGASLVVLGGGSLALGRGIYVLSGSAADRTGLGLLAIWGVGAIFGGIFPPDPRGHWNEPPSRSGMIHSAAALMAFLAFAPASLRLARAVHKSFSQSLQFLGILGAVSLCLFFVCLAPVFFNHPPRALGLVERFLLAFYLSWLFVAALGLRQAARSA